MRRLCFLICSLLAVASARAQDPTLVVSVHEARGGAVQAATVEVTGPVRRGALTDAAGVARFERLPTGHYVVDVRMAGFAPVRRALSLDTAPVQRLAVTLREQELGEVVVSATRLALPLSAVSGAVTVVEEGQIREQAALGGGLGDLLGRLVPGLGVSTGAPSIYGQSLRGRSISVMIDGVPLSTTRNTSRDLATIDPAVVERVEVIRGATALYGDAATGGIINIITRRAAGLGVRFTSEVSGGASLASPGSALEGRLTQTATGRAGRVDFTATATAARTGDFYDAEGDLIPSDPYGQGGLARTTSLGLQGRVGYTRGAQRLELTASHYDADQETGYVTDPSVDAQAAGTAKARAMSGLRLDENQGSRNTIASLDYRHGRLLGGRVHLQAFYRDYLTRFSPFDGRSFAAYRNVIQSYLDSDKRGARLDYERTLHRASNLTLLAGLDYTDERTQQPVSIMDSALFRQSGGLVFRKVGERPWVPLMNPRKTGVFGQVAWAPAPLLAFQGGVRYEPTRLHIDDFTTLTGNAVTGGEVAYDPVLFNVGATLRLATGREVYAAFSQGFSLTDLGLLLRNAANGFVVGNRTLEAQTVDNYEAGARVAVGPVRTSLAGFYTTSELGTTSAGLDRGVVRAPERVYGIEATLDASPSRTFDLGGTLTWTEGENDANEDGVYVALNTFRIQPLKATAYVEARPRRGWATRLQLLYSGSRTRAYDARPNPNVVGFGEAKVESYAVVDLTSSLRLGPGTLRLGVNNLLNRQYFPVVSQLMYNGRNSSRAAAPGAAFVLGYAVTY